jgi:hypothetical protein
VANYSSCSVQRLAVEVVLVVVVVLPAGPEAFAVLAVVVVVVVVAIVPEAFVVVDVVAEVFEVATAPEAFVVLAAALVVLVVEGLFTGEALAGAPADTFSLLALRLADDPFPTLPGPVELLAVVILLTGGVITVVEFTGLPRVSFPLGDIVGGVGGEGVGLALGAEEYGAAVGVALGALVFAAPVVKSTFVWIILTVTLSPGLTSFTLFTIVVTSDGAASSTFFFITSPVTSSSMMVMSARKEHGEMHGSTSFCGTPS